MQEVKCLVLTAHEAVDALRQETGRPNIKIYRYGCDQGTVAGAADDVVLSRGLTPDEAAAAIGKHYNSATVIDRRGDMK